MFEELKTCKKEKKKFVKVGRENLMMFPRAGAEAEPGQLHQFLVRTLTAW